MVFPHSLKEHVGTGEISRKDGGGPVDMPTAEFDPVNLSSRLLEDNAILFSKISAALNCEESEVPTALGEVIRFMYLANLNDDGMLTPSVVVDLAWHEFILCTRAYAQFCSSQFGEFIHHAPGGSKEKNQQQFQRTLANYQTIFGEPNKHYWGPTAKTVISCGECESN